MQNRKPGWGWGSEKEGSFPFFQNGHSDGRNHKWEKDKEKKTHPCTRRALNGWQLHSSSGKQDLPMSVPRAVLAKLLKQVVSNQIARGEWGCRKEGTQVLLPRNSFSRHRLLKELMCPTSHLPPTEIKIPLVHYFL